MMPYIKKTGTVFVCGDDDLLAHYDYAGLDIFTFGTKPECYVHAENVVVHGKDGITCDIVCLDRRIPVTIKAYGKHMILAALGAAAVCLNFGMSDRDIAAGIEAYAPVGGRAAVMEAKGYTFLEAGVQMVPQNYITLTDETDIKNMEKLIDMLEDNDDVQNVYHNWEQN